MSTCYDSGGRGAVLTAGHACRQWFADDPLEVAPRRINVTLGAYKLQSGGTLMAEAGLDVEGSSAENHHGVEFFYPSRDQSRARGGSNMPLPLRDADVCMLVLSQRPRGKKPTVPVAP